MQNVKLDRIQKKAVKAVMASLEENGRALVRMATGTGKTETAIKVVKDLGDIRVLWLTHRYELIDQLANQIRGRLQRYAITDVGVFGNGCRDTLNDFIVASIPTLARDKNLKAFHPDDFHLVIVDEAHHTPAPSWELVVNYFNGNKLALTATPDRPDGQSLEEYFGDIVFDVCFDVAVAKGLIVKPEGWCILTNSVLKGLASKDGKYSPKQLERLYSSKNRNTIIKLAYDKYGRAPILKQGLKPKTICYCINVQHAERMADEFTKSGYKSKFIVGDQGVQSKKEREDIYNEFKNTHKIEVLCVVDVLNEGVDVPDVNILLMCRPTQSSIIYSQQVGRGVRLNKGKKACIVLDFVDQTNTKFQTYTLGNHSPNSAHKNRTVPDYLDTQDPLARKNRVDDFWKNVRDFEAGIRQSIDYSRVTIQNIKKFIVTSGEYKPWYR